ncbi:MAG TPA: hypothetical protein VK174_01640, partial [Chitinophagales bacterium]|nr:hypothetical protein [Chitinophagales bacterium]
VMIIGLLLTAATALNAQGNSNAQYMGSERRPQDSVKSVYKDKPEDHAHVETIPIKEDDDKNGNARNGQNTTNGNGSGGGDNTTVATDAPVVENQTQTDGTTVTDQEITEACPERIGIYSGLLGFGGFILGLIVGFLIKGATDKNKDNRRTA